jgi:glycosyltransferase involved in cell wall biosynthesis
MRILQTAPLWERVPPPAYGGTEAVVSILTDGLVQAGHEVVLCASGDSQTLANLRSVYPSSLRTAQQIEDGSPYDWVHAASAIARAHGFDVIHNHAGELPMALASLADAPMLSTMHCLTTPDTRFVWQHYEGYYNTISRAQQGLVPQTPARNAGTVYNAIDVASFPFNAEKDSYLLSLNRIAPEKGTHLAIEVARNAGRKLIIAGKVDRVDRQYFHEKVEPLIDGRGVVYVGEADQRLKRELYAGAAVLLMPIRWEEPFGLVVIEAMACGTPVIAMARGSMPELIQHGRTGFLVHDVAGMVRALDDLHAIDPLQCRQHVEANFDTSRMVQDYLAIYERICSEESLDLTSSPLIAPLRGEAGPDTQPGVRLAEFQQERGV